MWVEWIAAVALACSVVAVLYAKFVASQLHDLIQTCKGAAAMESRTTASEAIGRADKRYEESEARLLRHFGLVKTYRGYVIEPLRELGESRSRVAKDEDRGPS